MDTYLNQPSTSSSSQESIHINVEEKPQAMFEYVDEHGQTVFIEAQPSDIYIDEEGNTIICEQSYEDFAPEVVQEEIVKDYDDSKPLFKTNNISLMRDVFPTTTVLMTNKSLEGDKAVLIGKPGRQKKKINEEEDKCKNQLKKNNDRSILNKDLPGMKNMFKILSESALLKVKKSFKKTVNSESKKETHGEEEEEEEEENKEEDKYDSLINQGNISYEDVDETVTQSPPRLCKNEENYCQSAEFFEEWPIYSNNAIDFKDACEILVGIINVPNEKVCKTVPTKFKQTGTFIIDSKSFFATGNSSNDYNGKWGMPSGKTRFYNYDKNGKLFRADDGKGRLKQGINNFSFKINLKKYESLSTKNPEEGFGRFQKKLYSVFSPVFKEKTKLVIVSYYWFGGSSWDFKVHDSTKRNNSNVIKKKSTEKKFINHWENDKSYNKEESNVLPPVVSAFYEGFTLYSHDVIEFNDVASILVGGTVVNENKKCSSVPLGYKQTGTFVIDLKRLGQNLLELRRDDNGLWGKPSGFSRFYKFAENGDALRVDKAGKLPPGIDYDVKIFCKRYEHPQVEKNFVRKIYTAKGKLTDSFEGSPNVAVIVYSWKSDPIMFEPLSKQNNVNSETKEFSRIQAITEVDEEFVVANTIDDVDDDVMEVDSHRVFQTNNRLDRNRIPVKRARFEVEEPSNSGNPTENGLNELKYDLIRRELDNQNRFSSILDRTDRLLTQIEQRFGIEGDISTQIRQQTWHDEDIIEEQVNSNVFE